MQLHASYVLLNNAFVNRVWLLIYGTRPLHYMPEIFGELLLPCPPPLPVPTTENLDII